MNYVELFPTIVGETILSDISLDNIEKYKTYLDNLKYEESGVGNYRGTLNQQILNEPLFFDLKSKILQYATEYLQFQGFVFKDIEIVNSWGTRTNTNETSTKHRHSNSYISGVYYLEDSSNINFYNPTDSEWMFELEKKYVKNQPHTHLYKFYTPKTNSLIIFPSYLVHEIDVSKKDFRRSLAFNIIPKGKLGFPTSYLNL
jgi:uncharacterized protein (TIGR02466 family)